MSVCKLARPPVPKAKVWHSQMDRVGLFGVMKSLALRRMEFWTLPPHAENTRFHPHGGAVPPTSGKHTDVGTVARDASCCVPGTCQHAKVNSDSKICFCWIFAFFSYGGLLVIHSDKGTLCKIFITHCSCPLLGLGSLSCRIPFFQQKLTPK